MRMRTSTRFFPRRLSAFADLQDQIQLTVFLIRLTAFLIEVPRSMSVCRTAGTSSRSTSQTYRSGDFALAIFPFSHRTIG